MREWGIYPEDCKPTQWWGARAIIERGSRLDLLPDRQNYEAAEVSQKEKDDFIEWINQTAIPFLEQKAEKGFFHRWEDIAVIDSDTKRYHCEATPKNSYGEYLYIGCWVLPDEATHQDDKDNEGKESE